MNEAELIQRFNAGDEKAFKDIFYMFYRHVFFTASKVLGIHHNQDSEDIALRTMQCLFEKHANFDCLPKISAYLHSRARGMATSFKVYKKDISYNTEACETLLEDEQWPEYQELHIRRLESIIAEIKRLKGSQRRVMEMIYFEGLTFDQVASLMGINRQTVYAHHNRAKEKLIKALCNHVKKKDTKHTSLR